MAEHSWERAAGLENVLGSPTPSATAKRETGGETTESRTTSTERVRQHRARGTAKRCIKYVEFDEEFLPQCVEWGFIEADKVDDPIAVGKMVQDVMDCKNRGTLCPGPIVTGTATS